MSLETTLLRAAGLLENFPSCYFLARYGGCNFEQKVRNAQEANYTAAIIYNINSDKLVPMGGDDNTLISSVFIGQSDASTGFIFIPQQCFSSQNHWMVARHPSRY